MLQRQSLMVKINLFSEKPINRIKNNLLLLHRQSIMVNINLFSAFKKAIACIEQDVACCLFLFHFLSSSRKLEREVKQKERRSKKVYRWLSSDA